MRLRLLIVGFGRVGRAFAEMLLNDRARLKERYGLETAIVGVTDIKYGALSSDRGIDTRLALDMLKHHGSYDGHRDYIGMVKADELIRDLDYDVLVEVSWSNMRTGEPALSYIITAFRMGRDVITTNKGPLAIKYRYLIETASKNRCIFRYEGTVLSGTPAINLGRECLAGAGIYMMEGILNGTTNYILSLMEKGYEFAEALSKAQSLGYAEADPSSDIEGWDPAAKAVIMANSIYDMDLTIDDVEVEGIKGVSNKDIHKASLRGERIKLLALIPSDGNVSVKPSPIGPSHPLYDVTGVDNAILYRTRNLGDVMVKGPGAGPREAAQGLLADLIYINSIEKFREVK